MYPNFGRGGRLRSCLCEDSTSSIPTILERCRKMKTLLASEMIIILIIMFCVAVSMLVAVFRLLIKEHFERKQVVKDIRKRGGYEIDLDEILKRQERRYGKSE